ncbi:fibronectin type III domain-containing protein [Patescibacteria group bacterium]
MLKKSYFLILILFSILFVFKTNNVQALVLSPPKNLSATVISSSQINLSWEAPVDNEKVVGYVIYRDNIQIIVITTGTKYSDMELKLDTTYAYAVSAYDEEGNESDRSNIIQATTKAGGNDIIPPSDIFDLNSFNETQTSIDVSWTSPGDDGDIGTAYKYDLRISETSILDSSSQEEKNAWWQQAAKVSAPNPLKAGSFQKTTITMLEPHKMYFLAIKTSDENNNWSNISNLDSATAFTLLDGEIVQEIEPVLPEENNVIEIEEIVVPVELPEEIIAPAKLPNSSYSDGLILASLTNDKIYFVVNGQKRWLANPEVYISYGLIPNSEVIVSQETLDKYPTGQPLVKSSLPEGTLIRGENDYSVYIINPPYKRHIFNSAIFSMYDHFKWDSIKNVSNDIIDSYITSDLYRASNDYRVYYLEEIDEVAGRAVKHHIAMSSEKFISKGYNWDQIFVVSEEERDYYDTGGDFIE